MKPQLIIAITLGMVLISCKNQTEKKSDNDVRYIEISEVQFESENMVIGEPVFYPFADKVYFTGVIIPSVGGRAQISLPLPGIIEKIHCIPAQMISKGAVLFEISGNWFIDLQKDFAESSAIISKLKSDYLRAKELYDENIGTEKEFTAAESNYYAENAKYKGLKTKLESMNLDVAMIEKGEFYSTYTIKSPISGYVSSINASVGQYVDPLLSIAELIDNNSFQLKLFIFEQNIQKIKIGQSVTFNSISNTSDKYIATINAISKTIMPDTKSIECYAKIENLTNSNLISNQFVTGEIFTAVDSVLSVPESAVFETENESYVLMYEKYENSVYYFKQTKVNTGRKANNYIELTEQLPSEKLLVGGTYNIIIE
jgi:cobalt-zinc-cadmium efflux system membrane fusion protein